VSGLDLPEHVQLSLTEVVGAAKEGLLALAVGTGLAVLQETMDCEVERVVGPKGRHDRQRPAKRHRHLALVRRGDAAGARGAALVRSERA